MTSPTPSTLEAMCQSYMGITMAESQEEINGLRAGLVLCIAISVVLVLTIGIACSIHGDTFTCNETGGNITNSNEVQDKEQKPSRRVRLQHLKTDSLNGRLGWTTRFLNSGEGKGRYHVVLDSIDDSPHKEGNFWPKNLAEINAPPTDMTEQDIRYSRLCAKRVIIIGLTKADALNGRTGIRIRYLTSGHGRGRFHVLLDGNHEPIEGNFWPKHLIQLDENEDKVGMGNGKLAESSEGKIRRLFDKRPELERKLLIKARRSKRVVDARHLDSHAKKIEDNAAHHKAGFEKNILLKETAAQRRLTARLNARMASSFLSKVSDDDSKKKKDQKMNKKDNVENNWE